MSSDVADVARDTAQPAADSTQQRQGLSLKPLLTLRPLILAHKGATVGRDCRACRVSGRDVVGACWRFAG